MRPSSLMFALLLTGVWLVSGIPLASAAGGQSYPLDEVDINLNNQASLQRGAKYFVNYCMGCHSATYMRYSHLVKDLGLTKEQVENNLTVGDQELADPMTNAMTESYGESAFGNAPPDLTLTARSRGADWLYTYLRTFYVDDSRPLGVNNAVFAGVGMPHVLWELQGLQKPVYKTIPSGDQGGGAQAAEGETTKIIDGFEIVQPGELTPSEYDMMIRDLVNFMVYLAEPAKLDRPRIGMWVLLYLGLFLIVAYYLKREYWKDVH